MVHVSRCRRVGKKSISDLSTEEIAGERRCVAKPVKGVCMYMEWPMSCAVHTYMVDPQEAW